MRASRENTKPTLLRRVLACLVSAAMVVAFTPVVAWGEGANTVSTYYVEAGKITHIPVDAIPVTSADTTWTGGDAANPVWYVVNSDVTISSSITVSGNVCLILADGCTLSADSGIDVSGGNSLTIYGQQSGKGELIAVAQNGAGIGGYLNASGDHTNCGSVTINGGTVKATGGSGAAGIGGSCAHSGGSVTINGGTVEATGGSGAAGIGNGSNYSGNDSTFSTGTSGNAVVFASSIDVAKKYLWSGMIFENGQGAVYGSPTLYSDLTFPGEANTAAASATSLTVPSGNTLTIAEDTTLTIANGGTLDNQGTIINMGTIIIAQGDPQNGTLTNNGTIINMGTITGTVSVNQPLVPVSTRYVEANSTTSIPVNAIEVAASDTEWHGGTTAENPVWYVVNSDVTIGSNAQKRRVTVSGYVNLILADNRSLTVYGGIGVSGGKSLTIYGQENGTGSLAAQDVSSCNAGIGGGSDTTTTNGTGGRGGDITINGGHVVAIGGALSSDANIGGAGIGGGANGPNGEGDSGTVVINGGTVEATGGNGGAGIGGGYGGSGGTVTITGGVVTAASTKGAGIGGGFDGKTIKTSNSSFSTTGSGNAVIFASSITAQNDNRPNWSGVIFEGDGGKVYGTSAIAPTESFAIPAGKTLTIDSGKTLAIKEGVMLANNGSIANNGTIYVDGTFTDNASPKTGGAVYYPLTLNSTDNAYHAEGDISTVESGKLYGKRDDTVTLVPEREGYSAQWSVSPSSVTVGANNEFQMPSAAVTVTATWTANKYTITFEENGGTEVANITLDYGTNVTLPTPTKTGYSFDGWYSDSGLTTKYIGTTMPAENKTLYAKWTVNQYTITFEPNGGTAVGSITQDYGTALSLPTPAKSGYSFGGWYCDSALSTEYTQATMPAESIMLYAKWLSQDASVQKVAVKGVEGTISGTDVSVTLPYNVALPTQDSDFVITPAQGAQVTTQPVKEGDVWKFVVTAEDSNCSATYTVTVKQQPAPYVPPTYNLPATVKGGIAVRVTLIGSTAVVAEISATALEGAAGSGAASITIDLSGLPKGVTQAQLSKSSVDKLLAVVNDKDNAVESVTVKFGGAVLTIDAKALAAVVGQMKGANVTLGVRQGTADSLNSAQKKALSPFTVVQLYFEAFIKSGGAEIHDFGGGSVRVSVTLEPRPGHDPARYVVLYVGEDGAIERYATAWADGMLSFIAPHFSAYAVVYVEDATAAAIDALEALPEAGELKLEGAETAVAQAQAALTALSKLDAGQRSLVDEALVANAKEVVARGTALIEEAEKAAAEAAAKKAEADAKAVKKVKNKAFSVKAGKSKSITFKTKASTAGTKVVYKKTKGSKYIKVTKTGKVTAKKGLKSGKTYTAKVKVTCGASRKTVKVTVRVR